MHIRKQRLLTPGPTPLYPPALHAMMASDIHHRTEDFRKVYRSALADLKEVMATSHDVLMFAASGKPLSNFVMFVTAPKPVPLGWIEIFSAKLFAPPGWLKLLIVRSQDRIAASTTARAAF